jgi:hypothetical protein
MEELKSMLTVPVEMQGVDAGQRITSPLCQHNLAVSHFPLLELAYLLDLPCAYSSPNRVTIYQIASTLCRS